MGLGQTDARNCQGNHPQAKIVAQTWGKGSGTHTKYQINGIWVPNFSFHTNGTGNPQWLRIFFRTHLTPPPSEKGGLARAVVKWVYQFAEKCQFWQK